MSRPFFSFRSPVIVAAVAVFVVAVSSLIVWRRETSCATRVKPATATAPAPVSTGESQRRDTVMPRPDASAARDSLARELATVSARLQPDQAVELLAALAARLHAAARAEAVAAVLSALDSGTDVATGLRFKVGPGGDLLGAPSFRVWLLDQLGRLDPAAAARYAAKIYAGSTSADEWAVALRNDWRDGVSTGRINEVRRRALELLGNERWAAEPSIGFLAAVDVSVAAGAWEAVPVWENWMRPGGSAALAHAAGMALDRLALELPEDFLPQLAARTEWLAGQPLLRASMMARADLASPRQRAAVETYLQRPGLAAEEAAKFFELIPNVNATVSHTLASTLRLPGAHDAVRLDRAALATLREWRATRVFARWEPQLAGAETRVARFAAEAERSGLAAQVPSSSSP